MATVLLFIFLTIFFTVTGQLLLKLGMLELNASSAAAAPGLLVFVLRAFLNPKVLGGLVAAVLAALCWMVAVSKSDISFAYPFMGLAIVFVLALSPVLLGEPVSLKRWVGVLLVCVGLWIAAQK